MSKQDRLDIPQFTYKVTKDGALFVYWHGRPVRTYVGGKAADVLAEIEAATSEREVQLALARVTGNFKRGNERSRKTNLME